MIEHVERLRTELQLQSLEAEIAEHREVHVPERRTAQAVATRISKCVRSWDSERGNIEPFVDCRVGKDGIAHHVWPFGDSTAYVRVIKVDRRCEYRSASGGKNSVHLP